MVYQRPLMGTVPADYYTRKQAEKAAESKRKADSYRMRLDETNGRLYAAYYKEAQKYPDNPMVQQRMDKWMKHHKAFLSKGMLELLPDVISGRVSASNAARMAQGFDAVKEDPKQVQNKILAAEKTARIMALNALGMENTAARKQAGTEEKTKKDLLRKADIERQIQRTAPKMPVVREIAPQRFQVYMPPEDSAGNTVPGGPVTHKDEYGGSTMIIPGVSVTNTEPQQDQNKKEGFKLEKVLPYVLPVLPFLFGGHGGNS